MSSKKSVSKKTSPADIGSLETQIKELNEALVRERADAVNVRRRADEERAKLSGFYKVMVVQQFLPALDTLERAMAHTPKDIAGHEYVKGVQAVSKQFERALTDVGVERIKTIGQEFDPKFHEAISMEDLGGDKEIISEELQAGYSIGPDVIRHAMVKVVR